MSRFHSYINSSGEILSLYKGDEPFSTFLKKYFSVNKKFGSKDRKQVSHLCYSYFRIGHALKGTSVEEKILSALFLCTEENNQILEALKPAWAEKVSFPLQEKISWLSKDFEIKDIFLWQDEISETIDKGAFTISHVRQPDVFVRVRPGKEKTIKEKLLRAGITHTSIKNNCIAFPNASKIEEVLEINKEAVIQDYNSQRVGEMLEMVKEKPGKKKSFEVWDCCAASGGKSILATDILNNIDITVTDIRESVLHNLKKRFSQAGIKKYRSFVSDLSKPVRGIQPASFDLIMADVPCSGSGTWGRTPEQLVYFNEEKINDYQLLQRKIVSNAMPCLKAGGYFLYITCSVFKKENEDNAAFIRNKFQLEVIKEEVFAGYNLKADTLFATLFRKPLQPD